MKQLLAMIFLLISTAIVIGCKNDKKTENKGTESVNNTAPTKQIDELYQHFTANPKTQAQKDENLIIEYIADNNLQPIRTASGLYYVIEKGGEGPYILDGQTLTANYRGSYLDGKEFDSSYSRGKPIQFYVGQMIDGWNEAMLYMRVGAKATLLIPSEMAYGERGYPGLVEPNSVLKFDVEILK